MHTVGECVECETCHTRFQPAVLATPTSASITADLATSMRAAVAAVVDAGDRDNVATRLAAVAAMASVGTEAYVDATLSWDLEHHAHIGYDDRMHRVGTVLEPAGREHLLTLLAHIAVADGDYTDGERNVLERVRAALGLSPAYVRGVLDVARSARH
jgi:tellurite resistance protein